MKNFRSPNTNLTCYLIIHRDEWVIWWECPGGSLPVDQQGLRLPIHHVLLHLGNVVAHIIDHMHVQVIRVRVEHLEEQKHKQK